MQEVDMLTTHGLRVVWQDFPTGERDIFHLAVGNLSSFVLQPLDDPLREILPPGGKQHLEGFFVAMQVGHVAHRTILSNVISAVDLSLGRRVDRAIAHCKHTLLRLLTAGMAPFPSDRPETCVRLQCYFDRTLRLADTGQIDRSSS